MTGRSPVAVNMTRFNCHVPADIAELGDVQRRLLDQVDRLAVHRDFAADQVDARHRVLEIRLAVLVGAGGTDFTRLFVHQHRHAAAVEVVDPLAVADAHAREDEAHLPAAADRHEAQGVDRQRIDAADVRVLDDKFLDEVLLALPEHIVEPDDPRARLDEFDAAPAGAVKRLCDDAGMRLAELLEPGAVDLPQVDPVTPVEAVEPLEELNLVLEQVPVLAGV